MPRLTLSPGGPLLGPDGQPFEGPHADATKIDVPHLAAHVVRYTLPKGGKDSGQARSSACGTRRSALQTQVA